MPPSRIFGLVRGSMKCSSSIAMISVSQEVTRSSTTSASLSELIEVATFSVDVSGANGAVAVSNAHGTVTGAAGGVLLRPYARLISKDGDSVTTYGEPWNMN